MKTKLLILMAVLPCAGCTVTKITTEHWRVSRTSFLQRVEMPEVEIGTNGTARLKGYTTDGGGEAAAAITGAAVSAAINSMK